MIKNRFKKDRGVFWDGDERLNMEETVHILNDLDRSINLLIRHGKRLLRDNENKDKIIKMYEKKLSELKEENTMLREVIESISENTPECNYDL